jgi:hypothetical protein
MAYIVIAYTLHDIEGEYKRIYMDSTEKYFDSLDNQNAKDYIEYIIKKGLSVDVAPINILTQGQLDVEALYKADALAKLTPEEKEALGI